MTKRIATVMLVILCVGFLTTPRDARADLSGAWTVDINWVPLFIDASFDFTIDAASQNKNYYTSNLAGDGGWAFRAGPKIVIMGNTNVPGLLYVGTNYDNMDEAIGGWQENTEVPNWGSFHMVRAPAAFALQGAFSGDYEAATGGQ